MSDVNATKLLKGLLHDIRDHVEDGNRRILAWYSDEHDHPEGLERIENPPHKRLFESGLELIHYASSELSQEVIEVSSIEPGIEMLLYGVGTEQLLGAAHLKIDSEGFVEELENKDQTPSFRKSKQIVIADLTDELDGDSRGKLSVILDIILEQRNNEAHLAYHRWQHSHFEKQVLEVAYFLAQEYSDNELDLVEDIQEEILKRKQNEGEIARSVDFDPLGEFA